MTREDQLIRQCKAGEKDALDELIRMYYPDILRYCLWHAPDRQSAEDATHETFLKAIRHLDSYVHRGYFRAFLYRIAANTCVDMRRNKWSSAASLPDDLVLEECGYRKAEADADFQRMVGRLPVEQRELVLLRFAQQLTLREIAEVTGLPLRTVQSRLRAALKKLKSSLLEGGWE
ncbi:MAG: RNA polymerase sigma factor [Clostridia bacterium]|nr:RNA polymerase sigma factor [Clostridia bacterium]